MSKRIANAFIDSLLSRVDIVNVIHSRVPLKKAGRNFQACCPFHNEKTPSFSVAPDKQFYYCFGCGAKGNAIRFLMEYEHLAFVDAVEALAESAGIAVEYEHVDEAKAKRRKDLYDVLEETAELYQKNLDADIGKTARSYLSERQLDKETADFFRLGYSQTGNHLQQYFAPEISHVELEKAGLVSRGDNGVYDQFRNRLMFPIRDTRGRVVGFGARALGDAKPKYLNSRETEVFSKRFVLYGLYETLQSTRNIEHLIVVEGYMDVIALQQKGLTGAVAALGTAFTPEHLALVKKYTNKIFICFDGDNAGRKAAERAMNTILPAMDMALEIRFVFLPEGEDPDTLVRKIGKTAFMALFEKGLLFSEFVFQSLVGDSDLAFVEGRGEVASRAKTLFDELPESAYKALLYQGLTERVGMDIYQLAQGVNPNISEPVKVKSNYRVKSRNTNHRSAESRLIRLLIAAPELAGYAEHVEALQESEDVDAKLLWCLINWLQTNYRHDQSNYYNEVIHTFGNDDKQRLTVILSDESFIEKTHSSETLEEQKQRLKTEFIEGFSVVLKRLQRKIS